MQRFVFDFVHSFFLIVWHKNTADIYMGDSVRTLVQYILVSKPENLMLTRHECSVYYFTPTSKSLEFERNLLILENYLRFLLIETTFTVQFIILL